MPATALNELDALRQETEAAVSNIIWAAEAILAACRADDPAAMEIARAQALAVIEACGFQDLTGQRLAKIADILRAAERELAQRRASDAGAAREETEEERRRRELMLSGPALDGPETRQSAIDAMFEGK